MRDRNKIFLHGNLSSEGKQEILLAGNSIFSIIQDLRYNHGRLFSYLNNHPFDIFQGDTLEGSDIVEYSEVNEKWSTPQTIHFVEKIEGSGLDPISWMFIICMVISTAMTVYTLRNMPSLDMNDSSEDEETKGSFFFKNTVNSIEQGGPVPLVYGQFRVGSTVIGSSIRNEEVI